MLNFFLTILWCVIGYVIGSIPWGLVIGKTFFHKDIREYGSHNLGGTNAGRVLGKPIGVLVIVLDACKALLVMILCHAITPSAVPFAGLFVSIGHCFPVFAEFRGGKGVACGFGYLLGLSLYGFGDLFFSFIYPVLIFFLTLGLSRMVSLSSMTAMVAATILSFIFLKERYIAVLVLILTLLVIFRHIRNIQRIIQKKESKVSFIK